MTGKTESLTGQLNSADITLNYPTSGQGVARPHAVPSTAGTQNIVFAYDANGNLCADAASLPQGCTSAGASQYTFDAENRLKTRFVSGVNVSYTYDGNGTMRKRSNADGSWTRYVGGVYELNSDGSW